MRFYERRKKLSEVVARELMPDRQFAEKAKREFLISFDMKQSSRPAGAVFLSGGRASGSRKILWRSAGVIAAACGVLVAASAFADVVNVPPTNPLYPLKRLAEGTTLAFSGAAERPALQLAFATRRVQEIKAIVSGPNALAYGPLVDDLTQDLDGEVSSSGIGTGASDVKGTALASFCGAIGATSSAQASGPLSLIGALSANPALQMRVVAACGIASSSVTGTDSISASAPLPSGLLPRGRGSAGREEGDGHAQGRDPGDESGISTTISSTANIPLPALNAIPSLLPADMSSSSVPSGSSSSPASSSVSPAASRSGMSSSASVSAGVTVPATPVTPPVSVGAGTGAAVSLPSLPL